LSKSRFLQVKVGRSLVSRISIESRPLGGESLGWAKPTREARSNWCFGSVFAEQKIGRMLTFKRL
jgi:hypothetical protein